MKNFWYLPMAIWAMGMVSCNNDEVLTAENESLPRKYDKIEVTLEEPGKESRATLQDNGSIFWQEGDEINVYAEYGWHFYDKHEDIYISETEKQWLTYTAETNGSNTGSFVCKDIKFPDDPDFKCEKQVAFYGLVNKAWYARDYITWDESAQKLTFKMNSEPENPFVMACKPDKDSQNKIQLQNAGAILKVVINDLPDNTPYYRLELSAEPEKYGLWGKNTEITFNEAGEPVWVILPDDEGLYNSNIEQSLREGDNPFEGECKSIFYFTIPPTYYKGGLKLKLYGPKYDEEGNPLYDYTLGTLKDVTGNLNVKRNDFIAMTFDYKDYANATKENIGTVFENSNYVRLVENDVILTSDLVIDKGEGEAILDLNGYTLIIADGTSLTNKSDLKIRNGKISVVSSENNIVNEGNISLFDVELTTTRLGANAEGKMGYALLNKGTAVLGGRHTESAGSGGVSCNGIINEGKMTIATGSYFFGALDGYCVYNQNPGAELYIYGGQYGGDNGISTSNGAKTVIYDCEVTAWGNDSHAITLMGETSSVIINDGTFTSHGDCIYNANTDIPQYLDERIVIKGGKFSHTSYNGAGIKWKHEDGYYIPDI